MPIEEGKPWTSQACGCHPTQVTQFNEDMKRHGIKCAHMNRDGTLECTSRKARRDVMKMRGLFDKDAGYGDQPDK